MTRVTVTSVLIGYGRVSTAEQNPAHQIDALTRAGAAERDIHFDTASGAKASRPKLDLGYSSSCARATPWSSPGWTGYPAQFCT